MVLYPFNVDEKFPASIQVLITGRTTRNFRHENHKFEWTVDECVKWFKAAAVDAFRVCCDVNLSTPRLDGGNLAVRDSTPLKMSAGGKSRLYITWCSFHGQTVFEVEEALLHSGLPLRNVHCGVPVRKLDRGNCCGDPCGALISGCLCRWLQIRIGTAHQVVTLRAVQSVMKTPKLHRRYLYRGHPHIRQANTLNNCHRTAEDARLGGPYTSSATEELLHWPVLFLSMVSIRLGVICARGLVEISPSPGCSNIAFAIAK